VKKKKCVPNHHGCDKNQHWDPKKKQCVANVCNKDEHWDEKQGKCVKDVCSPSFVACRKGTAWDCKTHTCKPTSQPGDN
jgi:hypothetical protein